MLHFSVKWRDHTVNAQGPRNLETKAGQNEQPLPLNRVRLRPAAATTDIALLVKDKRRRRRRRRLITRATAATGVEQTEAERERGERKETISINGRERGADIASE